MSAEALKEQVDELEARVETVEEGHASYRFTFNKTYRVLAEIQADLTEVKAMMKRLLQNGGSE